MTYSAVNQTKHNPHTQGIPDHVKIMNPEAVVPLYAPTTPKPASHYHHQQHHYSTTYSPYSAQVRAYMIFLNLNFPPYIMRLFPQPSMVHHSTTAAPYHHHHHHGSSSTPYPPPYGGSPSTPHAYSYSPSTEKQDSVVKSLPRC